MFIFLVFNKSAHRSLRTSNDIIDISEPNNPKIDTNNDIFVISFEFWLTGVLWQTAGRKI